MNFLPIAIRELQVTARRVMTYYWRSLSGLNAACVTLGCLLVGFSGVVTASSAGEMTFHILSIVGYGIAAVTAGLITSDCISEERREGTLGFLFLTDLKGYDIVLGKLSRLSTPVYCLIAAFPALGFTMLLGGVSIGDFARVALTLVNALFFFSALGLMVSACSWDGRAAVSLTLFGVMVFSLPMGAALAGIPFNKLGLSFLLPTPGGAFLAALESATSTVPKPPFLWSLLISHALGWLFLAAASHMVTGSFSKKEAEPKAGARARTVAGPNPSMALHAGHMEAHPWRSVYLLAAMVLLICLAAYWINPKHWYDVPTFGGIVLGMHAILKYWTANCACRALPTRRQTGELEILLTTPLDGDAILLGCTTAIKHQLLRPFLFVVAMDGLLLILGWYKLGVFPGIVFAIAMGLEFLWFIGNLYTLTWVGLWMGMKTANHSKALGRTLFYIVVLPWPTMAIPTVIVGIMSMGHNIKPWVGGITAFEFVVALVVCNLGFTGWAVSELRDRFRLLAAQQSLPSERTSAPGKDFLGKLRSWIWDRTPRTA